jgi:hypothetical protein
MRQHKFRRGNTVEVVRDIASTEVTQRLIGLRGEVTGIRRSVDPDPETPGVRFMDGTVNVTFEPVDLREIFSSLIIALVC